MNRAFARFSALHRPFANAQGKQECPPRRAGLCHEGILQGGEGEAIVAKSVKVSFHISLLAQGTTRETRKQLHESTVEGQL